MPKFKTHLTKGAATGLAVAVLCEILKQRIEMNNNPEIKFDWIRLGTNAAAGAGIGAFFGVLPDLLEPATCGSSHHRKFFHSISAASVISCGLYHANLNNAIKQEDKNILTIACASYLSHLILDSKTPRGLPLVA